MIDSRRFRRAMARQQLRAAGIPAGRSRREKWQRRNLETVHEIDRLLDAADTMEQLEDATGRAAACRFVPAAQHVLWQGKVRERLAAIRAPAPAQPPPEAPPCA
jgi:hypothetical protein